jgi:hypothetical protein
VDFLHVLLGHESVSHPGFVMREWVEQLSSRLDFFAEGLPKDTVDAKGDSSESDGGGFTVP